MTRKLVVACLLCAACAKSPLAPNGAATVSAPAPLSPANGVSVAVATQPVTLTVANAATTAGADFVTYTFEVATDAGFANTVVSKSAVQTSAQTALTLDVLPPAQYFWRARAIVGDTTGPLMSAATFTIVQSATPSAAIQAPTPVLPVLASTVVGLRPTLTVVNASRSGVGAVGYWFEVATDAGFASLVATGGAAEGTSRTSFSPASNLSFNTTYFWRARAFEISSGLASSFSATWTFVTGKAP